MNVQSPAGHQHRKTEHVVVVAVVVAVVVVVVVVVEGLAKIVARLKIVSRTRCG